MRIAILGVGLIGGSIGLAARARIGAEVCGYDRDERVCARALELGAIDVQAHDLASALTGAEVVFVATPVGTLADTVSRALAGAARDCVVSDVGSTKRALAAAVADERFVGGHPLAGAETAGVEHAREDLFDGATWYLTPAKGSTAGVLYERLHRLLGRFGAHPTAIDADTHDRLMAGVSHLPHVLANLLVAQTTGVLGEQSRLPAVGPSFRDATRVAGANSAIWTDIYMANSDALIAAVQELEQRLAEVRTWLAARDAGAIRAWNEQAREQRDALLGAGLSGGAEGQSMHELRASVPNRPGVIAEIALALGRAGVNILDLVLSPSPDNSQGVVALWVAGEQHAERACELIAGLGFPVVRA
ncbi:MAG TPA: prephenate dehydrogenase/arogenate dehydrogenase family protein [Solirubrobacteraceae bacterium]|jgi:prephenate dehydrogenase|nr:prephenate dehydrogenase/arogenate dehydrogenase family protein [Solirubrobacteraceae bacterium]